MMHLRRLALMMWAAPGTLLGLILCAGFTRRSLRAGVLLCEGATWPRRIGFTYVGLTLGHVILSAEDPISEQVLEHELVHVRQWERWGPLMIAAYPFASLIALLGGGHPYRDNRFEVEARRGIT